MDITDVLERSFTISIDKTNRDTQKVIFEKESIPTPRFFPGFTNKTLNATYKCALSHISIIKTAIAMGFPSVLIYEDDAYPRHGALSYLNTCLSKVPDDFNILILGWSMLRNPEKIKYPLLNRFDQQKTKMYGSHSYIISKKAYAPLMVSYENNDNTVSDGFYKFVDNVYMTKEPVFIQFSQKKSMNGHVGYILEGDHRTPPAGFLPFERYR